MKLFSDNIKAILGFIIIVSGIAYLFVCLYLKQSPDGGMLGLIGMATGYFFGSSTGSAKKDEAIQKLAEKQNETSN